MESIVMYLSVLGAQQMSLENPLSLPGIEQQHSHQETYFIFWLES